MTLLALAAALAVLAPSLAAGDPPPETPDPVSRHTVKRKRFYLRAGLIHVHPFIQSGPLELVDLHGPATVGFMTGPIEGTAATADPITMPAAIVGMMLPWLGGRLSAETVLGYPSKLELRPAGRLATDSLAPEVLGIPTGVPPLGSSKLVEARPMPIMVTAVYQLSRGPVVPYVGGGPALLIAVDAHVTNPLFTQYGEPNISIPPAPGLVLQTGVDANLGKGFYARVDVKFIAFMRANAEIENARVAANDIPLLGYVEVDRARMGMWLNPLIVQAGIGRDF
jgi:outer membrane protein W